MTMTTTTTERRWSASALDYLTFIRSKCLSISFPLEFPVQRSRFPISTSFFSSLHFNSRSSSSLSLSLNRLTMRIVLTWCLTIFRISFNFFFHLLSWHSHNCCVQSIKCGNLTSDGASTKVQRITPFPRSDKIQMKCAQHTHAQEILRYRARTIKFHLPPFHEWRRCAMVTMMPHSWNLNFKFAMQIIPFVSFVLLASQRKFTMARHGTESIDFAQGDYLHLAFIRSAAVLARAKEDGEKKTQASEWNMNEWKSGSSIGLHAVCKSFVWVMSPAQPNTVCRCYLLVYWLHQSVARNERKKIK